MRNIPASMRLKLLNRIKSASTESEPAVRVVATQASKNILLTEPIHEDIAPDFGDVALQQTAGHTSIELAYAVCIDGGIAKIYRRKFPAAMDYEWEYLWTVGEADDVAIEYDGDWTMDGSKEWYYLVTEQYPYLFILKDGDLYVQKWRDEENRLLLAEGVSEISSCKGWHDYTNLDNDQGLIIGYIKSGEVYYRSLAYSVVLGDRVWELEHRVDSLGTGNSSLSVIRTNDFRIGFMTEKSGQIKMALSQRTYPGASVKPEYIHIGTRAYFEYQPLKYWYPHNYEYARLQTEQTFFLFDSVEDRRIKVTSTERTYETDASGNEYCSGGIVYFDRPMSGELSSRFAGKCSVSYANVTVSAAEYDAENNSIVFSFEWKTGVQKNALSEQFSISMPSWTYLTYDALDGQIWYLDEMSAVFEKVSREYQTYENEYLSMDTSVVTLQYAKIEQHDTVQMIALDMTTTATFDYVPVGDIPV